MNKREFNAALRQASNPKSNLLEPSKAQALPNDTRRLMTEHIVRNRGPVAVCLLPTLTPEFKSWLHACGYMKLTKSPNTGLEFVHTSEHQIH